MIDANTLYKQFEVMFPEYASHAREFRPIGYNAISIDFGDYMLSKVFCYINDNTWHFGTKLWWPKPERKKTNVIKVANSSDIILQVIVDPEDNPAEYGLLELVDEERALFKRSEDTEPVEDKDYYAYILQ